MEFSKFEVSGNPNNSYFSIGFCHGLIHYKQIYQPFVVTHPMYTFYYINNRLTVEKKLFWPPKKVAEDIEFHHLCNEAGLLSVRCNSYFFCKAYLTPHLPDLTTIHKLYRWDDKTYLLYQTTLTPPKVKIASFLRWIKTKFGSHVTIHTPSGKLDAKSLHLMLAIPPIQGNANSTLALIVYHEKHDLKKDFWKEITTFYSKLQRVVLLVEASFIVKQGHCTFSSIHKWAKLLDQNLKVKEVVSNLASEESGYKYHPQIRGNRRNSK
jgi:hypothetical protein